MRAISLALLGLACVSAVQLDQHIRLHDDIEDHSDEYFAAADQGMTPLGIEYVRTMPEQFNEESDN